MLRKNAFLAAMFSCALVPSIMAQTPYEKPDDSWISISGTAIAADEDSFVLDYGENTVLVEMDDWDWYGDNYGMLEGDWFTTHWTI